MQKLAEICIRRPVFGSMIILALVVVGTASFFKLDVDRFPSVDLPTVTIRTTLPGASPEETETEISQRIEEVVNTVEGIEELRSISNPGASMVMVTFNLNRDIDAAAQDVRDRVATVVRNLPDDADPPIVAKFNSESQPVLSITLSGQRGLRELTELADKVVKRQIERSKGVGEVQVVGGLKRAISVWVDSDKLSSRQIPITAVRDALVNQNSEVPGGNLTGSQQEQILRTMGRISQPKQFNDIVITTINGAPVRIRDVGKAEDGAVEQRSAATLNGVPAVSLEVRRQAGANTVEVIEAVKANLVSIQNAKLLPSDVKLEVIRDQSRYIHAALHEINVHLVLGSIFASLVVLAFMRNWCSTIIAAIAIPASVISTFAMMWALNFTLNSVTMLALVLMVGIVIDDAIVVLENIFRFVEEKKLPAMEAAKKGTAEIGMAVLATTLSLVVIFIPVSFMSSISGRFLYQFGITAAVAVMVSLLVSFTLTPMIGARLIKADSTGHDTVKSRRGFYGLIDAGYTAMLRFVMHHRIGASVVALLVIASSVPLYRVVRQEFTPGDVDEAEFGMVVNAREGTSFAAMKDVMQTVDAEVRKVRGVRTTLATAGGSFNGAVNQGEIYVRIAPHEERYFSFVRLVRLTLKGRPLDAFRNNYTQRDVMQAIRARMKSFKDLRVAVRLNSSINLGGGGNFEIDFVIRGPDLPSLAKYTEALRAQAPSLGVLDADTTLKLNKPELRINIDRERAADLGVSPRDIGTALRVMIGGDTEVSRWRDEMMSEDYDVQLRLSPRDRTSASSLPTLLLPRKTGAPVELRTLALATPGTSPSRIDRIDRQRAANVRGSVAPGFALADRVQALRDSTAAMNLPPAYSTKISGRGRELERTFTEFLWAFLLSVIFMYMILAAQYESLIDPFTILLSLPLSVPFALFPIWIMGGTLNLYSALGILVLFGVVKKNAILQIDHTNQLRARGMERFAAIIAANRDRLRPILMTTLALVAGMLPLAVGTGPGAEERRAVAIVVIGGQSLSLLLTLLVTPVAYSIFDDVRGLGRRRRVIPLLERELPGRQAVVAGK